jgi:L-ascorbate metabolism protein UlaG (beta-lactamase superfamily)
MAARLEALPFLGGLRGRLKQPEQPGLSLYWLGQAGFLLRGAGLIVLIDPYLSDSLAEKYCGTPLPHRRMMPSPIALEELGAPDLILCTHHHTDHMDPGTLAPLLARWPGLRLVAPRAKLTEAAARSGVGAERIITMDAGESIEPLPGLVIRAIRAAHETLERDPAGAHVFLGYCLTLGGATVVHSGDTVPFPGQAEEMHDLGADLALFPVNGRSAALAAQRVPGNFFLGEAIATATAAGIPAMLAHHYGMFDFNTVPRSLIEAQASEPRLPIFLLPAAVGVEYHLSAICSPTIS